MFNEVTVQIRVPDVKEGQKWYETLLNRAPDFIPHEGFAEWELIPKCWLQVAEGTPANESGPIRLGVINIEEMRERLVTELKIEQFELCSREEVPVKWGTFSDPWGNRLGLFEYVSEDDKNERIEAVLRKKRV
ncbi:VOC family protein [Heyndrickxia sporothermodurans]|uniref:VOC family protein n=1 Tax=Heyndrickxia sporothermodurans TaxID=46224 RepID=UPI000D35573A|nr:ornithine monooxygenase [Heyndrickxia sporothermodurans]MBL5766416.1 VOC family protein [Heyndrickxia sporothermodurans]MBL5769855.1 VOC family protein [Heyndrickxia sporothermodurans]MBL5776934.1 VOC family protein [Heyndrickxia sporothermodurans]MBL5782301.1 VOC family protein [Heyndrickxia sporothermodurans]MBL5784224.1 VOC family protein [Heyndrickxia sporothermodurans]